VSEYDSEPIPGLPAHLPEGEQLLWQGSPETWAIARRVFHIGLVAAYFAVLLAWRFATGISDGHTLNEIAVNSIPLLITATAGFALIGLLAYLIARTTIYSITSRRVLMRFGVALPMSLNIPFKAVKNAAVHRCVNGSGDVALEVEGLDRLGFVHLWPHVRAWHVRQPQPTLRGLTEVDQVAGVLSKALHAAAGQPERKTRTTTSAHPADRLPASGSHAPAPA
jgi:hypothetical protein